MARKSVLGFLAENKGRWTEQERQKLKNLKAQNFSTKAIASRMSRSCYGVRAQLRN